MKRIIPIIIAGVAFAVVVLAFTSPQENTVTTPPQDHAALFPENISTILQTSCFDCHGDQSSNAKAKTKLNFGKWAGLSDAKKVGKMENIAEILKKGDMPPGRYLEKNPAAKLSQEKKDQVIKWTADETTKLMGGSK